MQEVEKIKTNKRVIYTAIFGNRDVLIEPSYIPKGFDFICFSDRKFKSKVWTIKKVTPPFPNDLGRSNRYYKIMVHKVLSEYEISAYIDGNVKVIGDINELIDRYLSNKNFACFDHSFNSKIPLTSLYEQKAFLMRPGQDKRNNETYENIQNQYDAYVKEGYPDDSGMVWTMTLLRRHNEIDVIAQMESWWNELLNRSKRDQMSFNYVAWKNSFKFNYIKLDGTNNNFIQRISHHQSIFKIWKNRVIRLLKKFL